MAKSFEEMPAWNKSRELVKLVYSITRNQEFCKDISLTDQIRRAAVSVMLGGSTVLLSKGAAVII